MKYYALKFKKCKMIKNQKTTTHFESFTATYQHGKSNLKNV